MNFIFGRKSWEQRMLDIWISFRAKIRIKQLGAHRKATFHLA